MNAEERDDILDDEYLRKARGIRLFSIGILRRCRQLGYFVPTEQPQPLSSEQIARQNLVVAWMLDERNSLDAVRGIVDLFAARPEEFNRLMDEYEFQISPALLLHAKSEVDAAQRALAVGAFQIEPKPGSSQGPSPQGK